MPSSALTWREALYLATVGGATALGIQGTVGHFAVGMQFDAQLVVVGEAGSRVDLWPTDDDVLSLVEKFLHSGDDRDIREVFVGGRSSTAACTAAPALKGRWRCPSFLQLA